VATDADNDTLTYGTDASFGSFDTNTGLFNWTPSVTDAGNYTVMFNVSDGNGGVDSETINIEVLDSANMPVANASSNVTTGLIPLAVQFYGSVSGGDAPFTYSWDLNDDGIFETSTQNATFTYALAGTYTVTLNVTDADGDSDTDTITIVATAPAHDIAVTNLTHSKAASTVWLDDSLLVQAYVWNLGSQAETFTLELVADGSVVSTQVLSLNSGSSVLANFTWPANVTGYHTLVVRALPVLGETALSNNARGTTFETVSADAVVSNFTREIFFNATNVSVGEQITAYLPVQNNDAITSYYDLIVALTGASNFTLAPATIQQIDLAGNEFRVVQWAMTSTVAGNFSVGAYEGNNEVTIPSKLITIN
jgi:PKD repeat protein